MPRLSRTPLLWAVFAVSFALLYGVIQGFLAAPALGAWPVYQPLLPCTAAPDALSYQCLPQHPDVPPKGTGLAVRLPVTNAGPVMLDIPGRGTKPLHRQQGEPPACATEDLPAGMLPTGTLAVVEDIGAVYVYCFNQGGCYCPRKDPQR